MEIYVHNKSLLSIKANAMINKRVEYNKIRHTKFKFIHDTEMIMICSTYFGNLLSFDYAGCFPEKSHIRYLHDRL